MNPMSYADTALELFMEGYNCAQVVFAAFAPVLGIAQADALRVSMGLGGGVGRMREVCGTVSGAAMRAMMNESVNACAPRYIMKTFSYHLVVRV